MEVPPWVGASDLYKKPAWLTVHRERARKQRFPKAPAVVPASSSLIEFLPHPHPQYPFMMDCKLK